MCKSSPTRLQLMPHSWISNSSQPKRTLQTNQPDRPTDCPTDRPPDRSPDRPPADRLSGRFVFSKTWFFSSYLGQADSSDVGQEVILSDPVWEIVSLADNKNIAPHSPSYMGHGGRRPTTWSPLRPPTDIARGLGGGSHPAYLPILPTVNRGFKFWAKVKSLRIHYDVSFTVWHAHCIMKTLPTLLEEQV